MNEVWPEIVEALLPYFASNVLESAYQEKVEECLRYLGWKKTNGTMQSQYVLPIGNNNTMRPDIVLFKPNIEYPVLPVEVKRPFNVQCERQVTQLKTYVRQLNLKVGLYFGEKIQLYYNSDNGDFVNVFTAEIQRDDANGSVLCDLLSFPEFDLSKLDDFCKAQYQQIQARDNLHRRITEFFSEDDAVQNTLSLLKDKFVAEGFDSKAVEDEFAHLDVRINYHANNDVLLQQVESVSASTNVSPQVGRIKSGSDHTKFSFEGSQFYNKRCFVLEVIRRYVKDHPDVTYDDLQKQFPDKLHSNSLGVIRRMSDISKKIGTKPDLKKRYSLRPEEIIVLSDGTPVVVTNQWGTNFTKFLEVAKSLYDVKSDAIYLG